LHGVPAASDRDRNKPFCLKDLDIARFNAIPAAGFNGSMVEKMGAVANKKFDRANRPSVDKFGERRAELAEAALVTLSELGYARTSLREIAQNSVFSHGVLHYYFNDKIDLIL
jgi:hypothetical protein